MHGLQQHRFFRANRRGRDYFVGDIHGQRDLLEAHLHVRHFEPDRDRLFAVGDLVDGGPDSEAVLELLDEHWFFSVCGNHELMLLDGMESATAAQAHVRNGGGWFSGLSPARQAAMAALIRQHCPLALTVSTGGGDIGVIHATAPGDWRLVQEVTLEDGLWEELVWDREDFRAAQADPRVLSAVRHVTLTVHGHVNSLQPQRIANRCWLDTLRRTGNLTLYSAEELLTALPPR